MYFNSKWQLPTILSSDSVSESDFRTRCNISGNGL